MSAGPSGHGAWSAVSVPLGHRTVDLLAAGAGQGVLFAEPGLALAGRGVAFVLDLPGGLEDPAALASAQDRLAGVAHSDRTGLAAAVRAFGTLPFDPTAPAHLVVPELTVGRDDAGRSWATLVTLGPPDPGRLAGLDDEVAAWVAAPAVPPGASLPSIQAAPEPAGYVRAVDEALRQLEHGPLQKVVLARSVVARFAEPPDLVAAVGRLHAQEPSCTLFSLPADGGRFFGASPELLVRRRGDRVCCHPLAGTVGLEAGSGGPSPEEAIARFLGSAKDRLEHRLVVEAVAEALGPRCRALRVPAEPSLVRLRSVAHLGTSIEGTLSPGQAGRVPGVLELLAALHPTPAVGGVPRKEALALIDELEAVPRGRWAGPVGWVDGAGDGAWVIGIRSASVLGERAGLHAGAGIVDGSVAEAELDETTVKLAPVMEALAPGAGALL